MKQLNLLLKMTGYDNNCWASLNMRKILCVRLDNMGDVLMCSPAFRAIKQSIPKISLTLLTSPSGTEIAKMIPEIDEVITFNAPWVSSPKPNTNSNSVEQLIEILKLKKFDAAVIMTTYSQSSIPAAFVCFLSGIPRRLAFAHENCYQLLNPWILDVEPGKILRHEVERQLELVKNVGCETNNKMLSLRYSLNAEKKIRLFLKSNLLHNRWFLLHIGATAPSRRYSLENYSRVIKIMSLKGWNVILTGSKKEYEIINNLKKISNIEFLIDMSGKLSLQELSALISRSPLLICNNTGPAHIASALGTPVVVLYAQTNMQHFPWTNKSRVLFHDVNCKNCFKSVCPMKHHNCLRLVSPFEVVKAAEELI